MINKQRLLSEFLELCSVPSVSGDERRIADLVTAKLQQAGFSVYEDGAGRVIPAGAGNIIALLPGSPEIAPVIFSAHMDSVESTADLKPVIEDGVIKSDGSTILGADDKTGIAVALEGIRSYLESGMPHGDIQCVFTVSEEVGLCGSVNLDTSRIVPGNMYVLDSGSPVCSMVVAAPSQNTMTYEIIAAYYDDGSDIYKRYDYTTYSGCNRWITDYTAYKDMSMNRVEPTIPLSVDTSFIVTLDGITDSSDDRQYVVIANILNSGSVEITRYVSDEDDYYENSGL